MASPATATVAPPAAQEQGFLSDIGQDLTSFFSYAAEATGFESVFKTLGAAAKMVGLEEPFNAVSRSLIKGAMKQMTPNQVLDTIATKDPKTKGLTDAIRGDPKLAKSFRNALIEDPSMLPGLEKMGKGEGNIDTSQLIKSLQNPNSRRIFGEVLDKIAESPNDKWNFGTLETLSGHMKHGEDAKATALLGEMKIGVGGGIDIGDMINFVKDLVTNPQMAMSNLADKLIESGVIPADKADAFREKINGVGKFVVKGIEAIPKTTRESLTNGIDKLAKEMNINLTKTAKQNGEGLDGVAKKGLTKGMNEACNASPQPLVTNAKDLTSTIQAQGPSVQCNSLG